MQRESSELRSNAGAEGGRRWTPVLGSVLRLASAVVFGLGVSLGLEILPPSRVGALDAAGRLLAGAAAGLAWLVLLWSASARAARAPAGRARIALLALFLAAAFLAPFASFEWARALWRGRFLLSLHVVLCLIALAALLCRGELRALLRRASGSTLLALTLSAGGIVLLGEAVLDWAAFRELRYVPDHADALELLGNFALNALLCGALLGAVWSWTGRFLLATLSVGASFLALVACDAAKLSHLREPVRVLDLHTLGELGSVLGDFVPGAWLAMAGALFLLSLTAVLLCLGPVLRSRPGRVPPSSRRSPRRAVLAAASLTVLLALGHLAALAPAARRSWLPWQESRFWNGRQSSLANGLLFHLLEDGLASTVSAPPGYGPAEIARIYHRADGPANAPPVRDPGGEPDLIVLMVESLMDPADLGIPATADPVPFLHRLMGEASSGRVVSPSFGGRSANAEFEVLTGLSMSFLPEGSLPYSQYVRRDLPALPRFLRSRGYRTVAVIVDPPSYYDRPSCYPRLGFEEVLWLDEDPAAERDASGRFVSDAALVEAVLEVLEGPGPVFVFAFSNATHAPYDRGRFPDSDLRPVCDPGSPLDVELGGYLNAVRETDRALERLISGAAARARPSVVAVLGDHLPPFGGVDGVYEHAGFFGGPPLEAMRRKYSVPVVLWTSFAAERRDVHCSANYLSLEILARTGLALDPFRRMLASFRAEAPVVASFVESADGVRMRFDEARGPLGEVLDDYRLVQYDLLFGDRVAPGGVTSEP